MRNKLFNWLIIIVGLILIVNLSGSIIDLAGRGSLVDEAEEDLRKEQEKNAILREKYREVQSKEFIERSAREKLGLGKEGEVVIVVPKNKMENREGKIKNENENKKGSKNRAVWRQWLDLFL